MDALEKSTSVLMLPWLAHGHISPYLELAKRLTKRNFRIYLCSTPINLSSIKNSITPDFSHSIQLVELHLPSLPSLPPHHHTTNGLPSPLLNSLIAAFEMAGPAFSDTVRTLKPDLVIYDFNQPWAASVAFSHNIPAVLFLIHGAAVTTFTKHLMSKSGKPFPFPQIHYRKYEIMKIHKAVEAAVAKPQNRFSFLESIKKSDLVLMKTFREIEEKYLDYLSVTSENKKMLPTGPLLRDTSNEDEKSEILSWLDEKEKGSTVLVSFGTEYFLSSEEIEELAHGLELSKVSFIWVLRFPMGKKIGAEEALPEGFLGRVKGRGMVVDGWAPQARILGHPSIGGFVSHCGWSSSVESMGFGVPIMAMPMLFEQPLNVRLMEEVGCCVEIRREEDGRLKREEVEQVIRKVLMEPSGEDVRKKARELSEIIRKKEEEEKEIDDLVQELIQLCNKA